MRSKNFFSTINPQKTKFLQTSIEWQPKLTRSLEQQITQTHMSAFLDLYQHCSEEALGLAPHQTKESWLREMIKAELNELKTGKVFLATVSIEHCVVGFITCLPAAHRHDKVSSQSIIHSWRHHQASEIKQWQDTMRKDVYISLLAVKPFRNPHTKEKIQIGLGRALIESVEHKMTKANSLTLDTRLVNKPGIEFYKRLGFSTTGRYVFGGSSPDHYIGCEKQLIKL